MLNFLDTFSMSITLIAPNASQTLILFILTQKHSFLTQNNLIQFLKMTYFSKGLKTTF